jgi:hypothetical protein
MPSAQMAYRAAVCILWGLGSWNAWECLGLYSDGAPYFLQSVQRKAFWVFDPARDYVYGLTQVPLVIALRLGVTDLHWLARIYSAGLIALPIGIYHLALARARSDVVLLAVAIAIISIVFMTTSFFAVGEYNTAYALGVLVAIWLATTGKLRVNDGVVLVVSAALAMRVYEILLYLGPLLAGMTMWTAHRGWVQSGGRSNWLAIPTAIIAPAVIILAWWDTYAILFCLAPLLVAAILWGRRRPEMEILLAAGLYQLAAALLLAGSAIAIGSLIDRLYFLAGTVGDGRLFIHNPQFVVILAAALVVVVWGLLRPDDIRRRLPYILACCLLLLLALSPVLALQFPQFRPNPWEHYRARNAAGLVVAAVVVFIWARTYRGGAWHAAFKTLMDPAVARKLLSLSLLMLLATLPSSIFLTTTWISFLDAMRTTIRTHHGIIEAADTPLFRPPHIFWADPQFLVSMSLALRSTSEDGVVVGPFVNPDQLPTELPDLGQFFWRD